MTRSDFAMGIDKPLMDADEHWWGRDAFQGGVTADCGSGDGGLE